MNRPIESYFRYPSEYDPQQPPKIEGYIHAVTRRSEPDGDEYDNLNERVPETVYNKIKELVLQSVANWPTADHVQLVSDRANIHPVDAWGMLEDLKEDETILKVGELELKLNI